MTQEELERTALKIIEVLKPCLKKTRGKESNVSAYPTAWGRKTEMGLAETLKAIIKKGGIE